MAKQAGLSQKEADKRLEKYGENKLPEKKEVKWLKVLLFQFKSPLIYVLVVAGGITVVLGDLVDAGVIGLAVVLNTVLGFYQEMKAERSLEALSKMLTPKAKVIRDGERRVIEASQVVPGDICILEIGERVPAGGVIIEEDSLSLNEAIITGESQPVKKHKGQEALMATIVASGIAKMRVTKTGQKTEVGKIAERLTKTKEEATPLQKQLGILAKKLAIMVGAISLIIFLAGLLVGDPFLEIFTTAVAVAVSAIPEGLVVTLTVILAIGMQRIFKSKALVRKLVAAETLGGVTVICADKTGTITEGKLKIVRAVIEKDGEEEKKVTLVKAAILCNDMRDALEIAMTEWAMEEDSHGSDYVQTYPRLDEIPFDPKKKYIATLHKQAKNILLVSGAPEVMIEKSRLSDKARKEWLEKFVNEGKKGYRLVGFAYRNLDKNRISEEDVANLTWLGYLVFEDPVRQGVKEALAEAKRAGVKVKVITGDYRATAEAVMEQLGMGPLATDQVMEGYELEKISDEELKDRIEKLVLFTRTNPEQKLRIVQALQENNEVVAMTGDGVNDAPAIKKADIGIVVDGASAVAQETADMVLLDSNFATIVAAIEEGRGIFVNLKKIILYLLSDAFAEVVLILGSMLFRLPLPVTASQILWINLVDDGLPDFALTLEPKPKELMREKPRGLTGGLLDKEIKVLIGLISASTGVLALLVFCGYLKYTGDMALARTVAFTLLAVSTLIYVFSCKSLKTPLWREQLFDNKWLWLAIGAGLVFQLLGLYLPGLQRLLKTVALGGNDWLVIIGASLVVIGLIEGVKWRFNHLIKKGEE